MSAHDPEPTPNPEWSDPWERQWSEADWDRYLGEQDTDIRRYLAYYDEFRDHPDRIDEAARLMGWEAEAVEDEDLPTEPLEEGEEAEQMPESAEEFSAGPYTMHRHPVFLASRAILASLHLGWDKVIHDYGHEIPARRLTEHQAAIFRAEQQAILAIQAQDWGDLTLAVCLYKRALFEINRCLSHVEGLEEWSRRGVRAYVVDARMRLFDLREIWLRAMADCRASRDTHSPPSDESA